MDGRLRRLPVTQTQDLVERPDGTAYHEYVPPAEIRWPKPSTSNRVACRVFDLPPRMSQVLDDLSQPAGEQDTDD
jgi:hypothetical protein